MGRSSSIGVLMALGVLFWLPQIAQASDNGKPVYDVKFELFASGRAWGTKTASFREGERLLCRTDEFEGGPERFFNFGLQGYIGEECGLFFVRPGPWSIGVSVAANQEEESPRVWRPAAEVLDEVRLEIAVENSSTDNMPTIGGFRYGTSRRYSKTLSLAETKQIVLERDDAGEPMTWLDVTLVSISDGNAKNKDGNPKNKQGGGSPVDTPPPTSRPLTQRPTDEQIDERSIFQFIIGLTR